VKNFKTICIIPARGGSKGLKLKNLRKVGGKPLIYYPIKAALKSGVCDEVFVTTDSLEIKKIAEKYGAKVPFLRKSKFAGDRVTTEATLQNALLEFEKFYNIKFDICVFLTCTNIFRKIEWITYAVNYLKNNKSKDSVFSVHNLYKHFWHYKNGKPSQILPWMKNYTSRQIAPKLYREDTGLACATRSKFWRKGKRIGKKVHFIVNEDSITGIDIHSEMDLFLANKIVKYLKKKKIKYT
jgi:CMP-N,N'-diacetyllegionaminic acid synthase